MKINWKLRFQNKATLTAIILSVITLAYQVLAMFGVVPKATESQVADVAGILVNILVLLGVVVDPTTKGTCDSKEVLSYETPKEE